MKYSGIQTDENLRFIKCPVCGNDEFSEEAEFCRICGSAIINYCQDLYDEHGYRISTGCGKPNPGNARFCEYCGNPTLLYKFLTPWEDEKTHAEKYGSNNNSDNTNSQVQDFSSSTEDQDNLTNALDELFDEDFNENKND